MGLKMVNETFTLDGFATIDWSPFRTGVAGMQLDRHPRVGVLGLPEGSRTHASLNDNG
jgi:hypothetical protein